VTGKQPWYFTAADGSPALTIAGLWDEWRDKVSGETLKSCTMIITEPNKFVAEVHDRIRSCSPKRNLSRGCPGPPARNCSSQQPRICCSGGRCRNV